MGRGVQERNFVETDSAVPIRIAITTEMSCVEGLIAPFVPPPRDPQPIMEAQPIPETGAPPHAGPLRIAVLVLAMLGYMTLWTAMRGDMAEPEVTLSRRHTVHPEVAKQACFTVWRRIQVRYEPDLRRLTNTLRRVDTYWTAVRQRAEQRKIARKHPRSLTILMLKRVDPLRIRFELRRITSRFDHAARQMLHVWREDLLQEVRGMWREMPRITRGERPGSERQTR